MNEVLLTKMRRAQIVASAVRRSIHLGRFSFPHSSVRQSVDLWRLQWRHACEDWWNAAYPGEHWDDYLL